MSLRRALAVLASSAVILLLTATAFTQARWAKLAPFPEPDEELYGVAAGGKLYVLGGFGGGKARGAVFEYDPAADSDGLAAQRRVQELLDGRIESVKVGMKDGRLSFHRSGFRGEQKENRTREVSQACLSPAAQATQPATS